MKKEILYVLIAAALLLLLLAYLRTGSEKRATETYELRQRESEQGKAAGSAQSYPSQERRESAPDETPGRPAATPGRSAN